MKIVQLFFLLIIGYSFTLVGQSKYPTLVRLTSDSLYAYDIPHDALVYLCDTTNKLSLQEVLRYQQWQPMLASHSFSVSNRIPSVWLKFQVHNQTSKPIRVLLGVNKENKNYYYVLDSLEHIVYQDINGGLAAQQEKKGFHSTNETVLVFAPQQTYWVYIKCYLDWTVSNYLEIHLPIRLLHANTHFEQHYYKTTNTFKGIWELYFEGIIIGVIAIMILYNLFLFLSIWDKSYLYFVLFLIPTGLFFIHIQGMGRVLFLPNHPIIEKSLRIHYIFGIFVTLIWFTQSLLATQERFPKWHLWLRGLWLAETGIHIVNVSNYLWGTPYLRRVFFQISDVILLTILISCIIVAIYALKQKYRPALYYIIACFASICCSISYIIFYKNSVNVGIVEYLVQIGVISMILLLSLSLSDRINLLKKELAQKELEKEAQRRQLLEQQSTELEKKVVLRTAELREANEELNQTNEELSVTLEKLQNQANEIAKQHEDIKASITYALRIQTAVLPTQAEMQRVLGDYFVFFQPRDIVSGDFYYLAQIENINEHIDNQHIVSKTIIGVVDCTGHGVPGAFMSLIGNDTLNEVIKNKGITQADQILNYLHKGVQTALRQTDTNNQDGMEVSLCVIGHTAHQRNAYLEFAGARGNIYYLQDQQLKEIRGDKMPIGGSHYQLERDFTTYQLPNPTATIIYLCSDGYQDQFGGADGRKFMTKRLRHLLTSLTTLDMMSQGQQIALTFEQWKGNLKQVDDVLVIGIKLGHVQ